MNFLDTKPGPGAYPVGGEINKTGFYFVSKYKSSNARTIGGGAIRKQASAGTLTDLHLVEYMYAR